MDQYYEDDSVQGFFKHTDAVYAVRMNPVDSRLILTGSGDEVAYVFDFSEGEPIHHITGTVVYSLVVSL